MSDFLQLSSGPTGRGIVVDPSGRLIATNDPEGGLFPYSFGKTGRALVIDASGRLVLSPSSTVVVVPSASGTDGELSPRDFDDQENPTIGLGNAAADIAAFQACFTAGGLLNLPVKIPAGQFILEGVAVPSSLQRVRGMGFDTVLVQQTSGVPLFEIDRTLGISFEDVFFDGIETVNDDNDGGNQAVRVRSLAASPKIGDNKSVIFRRCKFKGFGFCPTEVHYTDIAWFLDCQVSRCSHGPRFLSCKEIKCDRGSVRDSTLTTKLAVGVIAATVSVDAPEHNQNVSITNMEIDGFKTGESVLVHDGVNVVVSYNKISDALLGVAVAPFGAAGAQVVKAVTLIGNTVKCTPSGNAATETDNSGFSIGGKGPTNKMESVTLIGNQVYEANKSKSTDGSAAFKFTGYYQNLTAIGNEAFRPNGAAFSFGNEGDNVRLIGNGAYDIGADSAGHKVGFHFRTNSRYTGLARDNGVASGVDGFLVENGASCSGMHVYEQRFLDVENEYTFNGTGKLGRRILQVEVDLNPGEVAANSQQQNDVNVSGASMGDFVVASFTLDIDGLAITAAMKSEGVAKVTLLNNTGSPITVGAGKLRVRVLK